jgi:cytochrome c peroxidase
MKKPFIILILLSGALFGFIRITIYDQNHPTIIGALPETGPIKLEDSLKVSLGRLLFWDPVLSGNKKVACASCHNPQHGYTDNLDLSIGIDGKGTGFNRQFIAGSESHFAKRNSQTILNSIFNGIDSTGHYDPITAPMFWDNRTKGLELQAIGPLTNHEEMRGNAYEEKAALDSVVQRVKGIKEYIQLFEKAFTKKDAVTAENITKALATFEGTLLANNSPFDKYMRGDETAMTAYQIHGMNVFIRNGCANCHNGPMLSDFKLHVLSVQENQKLGTPDLGANDTYAFRTPSLRNLEFTWPYFHNGTTYDLNTAIDFYRTLSNGATGNPKLNYKQVDPLARAVIPNAIPEIMAFLDALNDPNFDKKVPARVPSKLPVGGDMN